MASTPVCSKCRKNITERVMYTGGVPRHSGCFVCEACGVSLLAASFLLKGSVPYCSSCWTEKFQPKCMVSRPLLDYINFLTHEFRRMTTSFKFCYNETRIMIIFWGSPWYKYHRWTFNAFKLVSKISTNGLPSPPFQSIRGNLSDCCKFYSNQSKWWLIRGYIQVMRADPFPAWGDLHLVLH